MDPISKTNNQPLKPIILDRKVKKQYGMNKAVGDISDLINNYCGPYYAPKDANKIFIGLEKAAKVSPTVAKSAGIVGVGIAAAQGTQETIKAYKEGGKNKAIKTGTKVAGGIAGSYAGAKLGAFAAAKPAATVSIAAGPLAGGVVLGLGILIGSVAGYYLGEELVDFVQYVNE